MQGHAKEMYDAFGQRCDWTWGGLPMPRWAAEDWPEGTPDAERTVLSSLDRSRWEAAAAASTMRVLGELETLQLEVKHGTLPDSLENTDWKLKSAEIDMVLCALGELQRRLAEDEVRPVPQRPVEGAPLVRLRTDDWRLLHDLLARARVQVLADTAFATGPSATTMAQVARSCDFLAKVALVTFIRGGTSGGSGAAHDG